MVSNKGVKSLVVTITGGCQLPDMGAGNQSHVLWKKQEALLTIEPSPQPPNSSKQLNGGRVYLGHDYGRYHSD